MDTVRRESHTPCGHALRSVLLRYQHAIAAVPVVRPSRGMHLPATAVRCRMWPLVRRLDACATGWHTVPYSPTLPAARCYPASGTPCQGYPAARPAPIPAGRPAPKGLRGSEAGF